MRDSFLSRNELVGLLAGIAPFFVSCSSSSTSTVNGRVVESSYFDLFAVVGGAIAVLVALSMLGQLGVTAPEDKAKRSGVFVLMIALGAFQILRGFGVIG